MTESERESVPASKRLDNAIARAVGRAEREWIDRQRLMRCRITDPPFPRVEYEQTIQNMLYTLESLVDTLASKNVFNREEFQQTLDQRLIAEAEVLEKANDAALLLREKVTE